MMVKSTIAEKCRRLYFIAVDLAKDPVSDLQLASRSLENKALVYNDKECIRALEEFIEKQCVPREIS